MSNTTALNLSEFTKQLIAIRLWEERNLPRSQSRIAFDLMVFIAHCHYNKTPLTLKLLFNSLTHSERGIRYVLDQFLENEWCIYRTAFHDKRFRHIYPTDKFIDAFENYYRLHVASSNRVNP
jgi:hypothetical protein